MSSSGAIAERIGFLTNFVYDCRILFGLSVGIVVSSAKHRPDLLRGITSLMAWVVPSPQSKAARRVAARS